MTPMLDIDHVCNSEIYWGEVACSLSEPDWSTSVGIPRVVTVAGIAVAYSLVRRQIQHDRLGRGAETLDRDCSVKVSSAVASRRLSPRTARQRRSQATAPAEPAP